MSNAPRVEKLECRDCEWCGFSTEHKISRVGMERWEEFFVVMNRVVCLNCKAVYSERKMVLPK